MLVAVLHFAGKEVIIMLRRLFNKDEEGQGLVEYAIILFLVAIVCIAVLVLLGPQVGSIFSSVFSAIGGTAP